MTVKSSKKSVATAKRKGKAVKITAKKKGTAVIKVKVEYGKKRKKTFRYKVTVKDRKKAVVSGEKKESPSVSPASEKDQSKESDQKGTEQSGTMPDPTLEPVITPTPEPTPKYTYELEILNNDISNLYSGDDQYVLVHVKTDNPDSAGFKLVTNEGRYVYNSDDIENPTRELIWQDSDISMDRIITSNIGDIHYTEYNTLSDGYLIICSFETSGIKELTIREVTKASDGWAAPYYEKGEYMGYTYSSLHIETNTDNIVIEIKDYDRARMNWYDSVMREMNMEQMSDYEKIYTFADYVRTNFKYHSITEGGNILMAEYAEVVWETKYIECGEATRLVGGFAEYIGLSWEPVYYSNEAYHTENGGFYAGSSHVCNKIYIGEEEYIFEGCPAANGQKIYKEDEINYII